MLQVVYCNHQTATLSVREKLAFSVEKLQQAYAELRQRFPLSEAVVLSTCNRVELYVASEQTSECPSHHDMVSFLAEFHGLDPVEVFNDLFERTGEDFDAPQIVTEYFEELYAEEE